MGSRVGSNPTGVVRVQSGFVWKANTLQVWGGPWACAAPWNQTGKRAVLGIEPRTSHTRSENHATRPNSQWCPCIQWNIQLLQPLLSTSWLCWVKIPCTPAGKAARTNTPAGQKHERSTVCRGAGDIAPEVVLLSRTDWPSSCHPWQKTLWPSGSGVGLLSRWGLAWARIPQVSCVCKVALCGRRIHCKSWAG